MHIKFILYKLLFISYKHLSDAWGAGVITLSLQGRNMTVRLGELVIWILVMGKPLPLLSGNVIAWLIRKSFFLFHLIYILQAKHSASPVGETHAQTDGSKTMS